MLAVQQRCERALIISTDEHALLQANVESYLRRQYDLSTRGAILASEAGWSSSFWRGLAEQLGILAVGVPESAGGLGGGQAELMIIMEAFGTALVSEPVGETLVIGSALTRWFEPQLPAGFGAGIAEGDVRLCVAYAEPQARFVLSDQATRATPCPGGYRLRGQKAMVVGGPIATHILVSARTAGETCDEHGISLFLAPADTPNLRRRDYRTIDGRLACDLWFEDAELPESALLGGAGNGYAALSALIDEATVAICAEACGVLRRLYEDTVAYTQTRRQFGQPLASFQVLQHRMVDMYIQVEQALAMTAMATESLGGDDRVRRESLVSACKVIVGRACLFVAESAVQLHGGMGITDELAVGRYFKRAITLESQYGEKEQHKISD